MKGRAVTDIMTIKEAAQYLKLNYMTVYKLAQKGKIPASKVGGNWRFKKEILDDWLLRQTQAAEGAVLVVDDDVRIRDLIRDIASEQGYRVVGAESGEKALEEMERQRFDLIFLDLVLPGMSGVDTLSAIKNRDPKATVAVVTGYGDDPIALQAMSMGPVVLIRKPFQVEDIQRVLGMVLKARR
jgi:excisionase family DNA binding protein